jgi:hypothetical protein
MLKQIVFLAAITAASSALAQNAEYARFVADTNAAVPAPSVEEIRSDALKTLQAIAAEKKTCAPTGIAIEAPSSATADRMITQLVMAGKVKNGWTAYGRPQGCGEQPPTRFMVLRLASGEVIARVVNIGEAIAGPTLMRDSSFVAATAAYTAIQKANSQCTSPDGLDMVGTRVTSRGADLGVDYHGVRFAGSWEEGWTFRVCGKSAEVPIRFTADGQGGANWNIAAERTRLID